MLQYHHHAGGFVALDEETTDLINNERAKWSREVWNKGYTPDENGPSLALRNRLKEAGLFIDSVKGKVLAVYHHQNKDDKNVYDKCRVEILDHAGAKQILSLDIGSEFTQRLLQKLEALGRDPLDSVTIKGFPSMVDRNGRMFCNHIASMKDPAGNEVKTVANHNSQCQTSITTAIGQMESMGIPVTQNTRTAVKNKYYLNLLAEVEKLFPREEPPAKAVGTESADSALI